jgi:hypothetical protein
MDSVVFDLRQGPGTVAQVVCSRASIERSSERQKKLTAPCYDSMQLSTHLSTLSTKTKP